MRSLVRLFWRSAAQNFFAKHKRRFLAQLYTHMLTLIASTGEYMTTVEIRGPMGVIRICDLVWCPADRLDILEIYYWESYAVLQGAYHCCFSIPGKVTLLKP
jgi:hypothetical protein